MIQRAAPMVLTSLLGVWLSTGPVHGQTFDRATIDGRAVDETGGVLPGVTVTGRSPALQLPQVIAVTGADGTYQLRDLPPGVYQVTFELGGFQTIVQEGIRLNAGFTGRVDVTLKVGSLEEGITVSGQSPLVDVKSTTVSTSLVREVLDAIPTGKGFGDVIAMAPGVRYGGVIDVGGSRIANFGDGGTNFGSTRQTPRLEGINTVVAGGGQAAYYDEMMLEEVQVNAVGNDAEVGTPGLGWNAIAKSGGNQFHGLFNIEAQGSKLQGDNLDARQRASGITRTNSVRYQWDIGANFGGRIIRDKLWFFVAERHMRRNENIPGYASAPGADGRFGTTDDVLAPHQMDGTGQTAKVSWQVSKNYRLIGFHSRSLKHDFQRDASRFRPYETTFAFTYDPTVSKVEFVGVPNERLTFSILGGRSSYLGDRAPQPDIPLKPVTMDITTLINTGGAITRAEYTNNPQFSGSLSYFPAGSFGGRHEIKAGYQQVLWNFRQEFNDRPNGNYILIFDNGRPLQMQTENRPANYGSIVNNLAFFVKDSWRMGNVTANLGLRWERYDGRTKDVEKPQGTFGGSGFIPGFPVYTWTSTTPRLGLAWDIAGDGKSVLKASWGRFTNWIAAEDVGTYSSGAFENVTYTWRDLNGNRDYDTGEVNLARNSPDFISAASANRLNSTVNPNLKQPYTDEMALTFERDLGRSLAFRALGVYKTVNRLHSPLNALRPYSAWNIPISRRDPGPDGAINTADDGGMVQLWDFDPAFRGQQFFNSLQVNADSDHRDSYRGFEVNMTKRPTGRWDVSATYQMLKNRVWRGTAAVPSSPNDLFFPLNETWDWSGKIWGSYRMPYRIQVSGVFNFIAGTPSARTYVFRTADPLGGRPLSQAGTLTIPLEPIGERRLPAQKVMNLRIARAFLTQGARTLAVSFNLYNVLNDNTPTSVTWVSGPAFGTFGEITPPRIARFGVEYRF